MEQITISQVKETIKMHNDIFKTFLLLSQFQNGLPQACEILSCMDSTLVRQKSLETFSNEEEYYRKAKTNCEISQFLSFLLIAGEFYQQLFAHVMEAESHKKSLQALGCI